MKVLKRIPQMGIVAGVIAGFSEYFAVDVTVLRVLYILFVLATGFFPGVFGYFIAVLLMPVDLPVIHEVKDETG
jgi:phage shock protein C